MKRIYKGTIKNLHISPEFLDNCSINNYELESTVVKKDALFYKSFLGVPVSLEYDTPLPTIDEAETYVKMILEKNPNNPECAHCSYAEGNYTFSHEVTRKEFKKLVKTYKNRLRKKNQ